MTDNINNNTDTIKAERVPAPNGHRHGPGNGASSEDPGVNKRIDKGAGPLSKKQQKAQQRAAAKAAAARALDAVSAVTGAAAPEFVESTASLPSEVASTPLPATAVTAVTAAEVPIEAPFTSAESLRLRMKVWVHPMTATRYLMPSAFMRDIVNGQPVTDVMVAYAMRDDDTMIVTLTAAQWNALPFFYFQEEGPAPRAPSRPVDVVVHRGRPG